MTEITSVRHIFGDFTEDFSVNGIENADLISIDYDVLSPAASTHHSMRLTYDEAIELCKKVAEYILKESAKNLKTR